MEEKFGLVRAVEKDGERLIIIHAFLTEGVTLARARREVLKKVSEQLPKAVPTTWMGWVDKIGNKSDLHLQIS